MSEAPVRRITATSGSADEAREIIEREWRRLRDHEPPWPAWTILDTPAGAAVVSRYEDYAFDANVATAASMPRRQSWMFRLLPDESSVSWRGGKWSKTNREMVFAELERRGLGIVTEMVRNGGGHIAARVEASTREEREAIVAELGARPGWEVVNDDGAVVRGPGFGPTHQWASELTKVRPHVKVFLFWRPWLRPPAVLEISTGGTRAWYPHEVTDTPEGVERVESVFGATDWPGILAAGGIPTSWFPDVPEYLR